MQMKSHTTIGDITVYTLDFVFVIYTYTDSTGNKYSKFHKKNNAGVYALVLQYNFSATKAKVRPI